jgi:heme oxygenase (biliverdin-IX-beta and delta-forming)
MAVFLKLDCVNFGETPILEPTQLRSATPAILNRLRLETRGEHEAVEQVLNLMDTALTMQAYCQRLAQFFGFYQPLEAQLQARCTIQNDCTGEDTHQLSMHLPRLNKATLLRQDLSSLGESSDSLTLCRELPPLDTPARVLGCLYVLEGATLGGRLITQHIQRTVGITPGTGGSFFEGYGKDTAKMWQTMRQSLIDGAPDTPTENEIVSSAIATFSCLRDWCETFNTHAHHFQSTGLRAEQHA